MPKLGRRWRELVGAALVMSTPSCSSPKPSSHQTPASHAGGAAGAPGMTASSNAVATTTTGAPLTCNEEETLCADGCVDLETDSLHCGDCGARCDSGRLCENGTCTDQCAAGYTECRSLCVDTTTDATNCGACGFICGGGNPCLGGKCGCPEGSVNCDASCVTPELDVRHCGGCDTACPTGAACIDGSCECPGGTRLCGESCVSLSSPQTCGSCSDTCETGEICRGQACAPAADGCPSGTALCDGGCVDLETAQLNCGSCGNACAASQTCEDGVCVCPSGLFLCDNTCVDLATAPLNCGACASACTNGQACRAGSCECTQPGHTRCGSWCTLLATDRNNCGSCGNECGDGRPCIEGVCQCPGSEALCDGECVDLESSIEHCGGCGLACPEQESCVAGSCWSQADDSCLNQQASDISISEIAVYQAGKVSIMQAGLAVSADQRPVDIVANKRALFRVSFAVATEWQERIISARLSLTTDEGVETLFHKKTVIQSSSDAVLSSTFNIAVPAELLTPGTSYAVELVECESHTGTVQAPRFPSQGAETLQTREVGSLKVEFIPVTANGITADSSEATLNAYRDFLEAIYPVSGIEVSLGAGITATAPVLRLGEGWSELLDQLSARHQLEAAANDLYYFGLVEPAQSYEEYCTDGCIAGNSYLISADAAARHHRVATGVSFGTRASHEVAAHELGHAHGRDHADCGSPVQFDEAFPHPDGLIGWWGFEAPNQLHPGVTSASALPVTDIMGYCPYKWISDYTYQGILERIALLNSALYEIPGSVAQRYRTIVVGVDGASWGVERPGEMLPSGKPEPATIVDARGNAIAQVSVFRQPMGLPGTGSILVPEPTPGWHGIQIDQLGILTFDGNQQSLP